MQVISSNERSYSSLTTHRILYPLHLLLCIMICACTGQIQDPLGDDTSDSLEVTRVDETESSQPQAERTERTDPVEEVIQNPAEEVFQDPEAEEQTTPSDELEREALEPSEDLEREALGSVEGERVSLIPPEVVEPLSRPRRRLNLDQLSKAIEQATGGLRWIEVVNGQERDLFVTMAATLGKPDFIQSTTEDLDPSALFQKFLGDAARQVCQRRVDQDLELAADPRAEQSSTEVKLWGALSPELTTREDEAAVEGQIRTLVLRFHSRLLPEGPSPRLAYWRWLFETALLVDGSATSAWRALCVALITHPDFYSY